MTENKTHHESTACTQEIMSTFSVAELKRLTRSISPNVTKDFVQRRARFGPSGGKSNKTFDFRFFKYFSLNYMIKRSVNFYTT